MTLTEFLLARIAEDEAEVADWPVDGEWGPHPAGGMWTGSNGRPIYAPKARVLADCEAKRRIVEEHGANKYRVDPCDAHDANFDTIPCDTLLALALPYADHPDYREEWKP